MIVSRKMAEEAMADLGIVGIELDALTEEWLSGAWRSAVQTAHPDKGGSIEAFARVDRAKHVLLRWLEKAPETPTAGAGTACDRCDGKGFVDSQRGWRSMRVQCARCRGTGCLDAEHEKGAD